MAVLFRSIQDELQKFDSHLLYYLKLLAPDIQSLIEPHVLNQGKRVRPALVFLSAALSHNSVPLKCYKFASVVELIHSASLFHDDVLDNSTIRRKKATLNKLHGNDLAVLAGDILYIHALSLMADEPLRLRKEVHRTVIEMTQSEVRQGMNRYVIPDQASYYDVIKGKTASLIRLSCLLGSSVSDSMQVENSISRYGLNLGLAFQVVDDLLDWTASEKLGKPRYQDCREGRVTLPVIELLNRLNNADQTHLKKILTRQDLASHPDTGTLIYEKMIEHKIPETIRNIARDLVNPEDKLDGTFDSSSYFSDLMSLKELVINRDT